MSEFFFGMGSGHLPERFDEIAQKHDARLVNYTDPGTGEKRHWFATQNRGNPYDGWVASDVMADIAKEFGWEDQDD